MKSVNLKRFDINFTRRGIVITDGEITVQANTAEEAMELVKDKSNWLRYLEISNDFYEDEDTQMEFKLAED